jgi:hypothetical protein
MSFEPKLTAQSAESAETEETKQYLLRALCGLGGKKELISSEAGSASLSV